MPDRTVLIDFENIPKIVPAQIPPDVCVLAFFGASLKSVARDYHKFAMELGKQRCVEIDIHGHGKNALDFHIAFYLGEYLTKTPSAECVVLSKDKGFDPLVAHLCQRKFNVRREGDLADAFRSKSAAAPKPATLQSVIECLTKLEKKARPGKRKTLLAHVSNHFKHVPAADIEKLVDKLFDGGQVSESDGKLVYEL